MVVEVLDVARAKLVEMGDPLCLFFWRVGVVVDVSLFAELID